MEEIFAIIIEVVIVYILQYPGAYIRWYLFGQNKSFEQIMKDTFFNVMVSLFVIGLIIILIMILKGLIKTL